MLLWLGSFQICECFVDFRFKLGALLGRKTYVYSVREGKITFPEVSFLCCNIITAKIKQKVEPKVYLKHVLVYIK